jgi:hypothetical protein
MKRNSAFSLIEMIVYMGLCSLLSLGLFRLLSEVRTKSNLSSELNLKIMRGVIPIDILRRDMLGATKNLSEWDFDNMVFRKYYIDKNGVAQNFCVGWYVSRGNLYRLKGQYDFIKKGWLRKSRGLLCKNVTNVFWKLKKNNLGFWGGVFVSFDYLQGKDVLKKEAFINVKSNEYKT